MLSQKFPSEASLLLLLRSHHKLRKMQILRLARSKRYRIFSAMNEETYRRASKFLYGYVAALHKTQQV